MNQLNQEQLNQHVKILGWIYTVANLFFLVIGFLVYYLLNSIAVLSGDLEAVAVLSTVGVFIVSLLTVLGLPGIVAGLGLLAHKSWARYLAIVLGILNLLNVPLGTIIGAYTLWVLMQDQAVDYFDHSPRIGSSIAMQH